MPGKILSAMLIGLQDRNVTVKKAFAAAIGSTVKVCRLYTDLVKLDLKAFFIYLLFKFFNLSADSQRSECRESDFSPQ